MHMRIWFMQRGAHVHCRVFTAASKADTHAKNGDLTFSAAEWPKVRAAFESIAEVEAEDPPQDWPPADAK